MTEIDRPKKSFRRTASDTYPISARVSLEMLRAIDVVIQSGRYLRVSDYLRDVVRKDLELRGVDFTRALR